MEFFTSLPTPLPLLILKAIPDFETLHSVIHASPSAFRLFCEFGNSIIDRVSANVLDTKDHYLLSSIARIRANGISPSLSTLKEVEAMYLLSNPLAQSQKQSLSGDIPFHVLLGLITTAINIQELTVAIIDELLSRISSIKPMHANNRSVSLSSNNYLPAPAGSEGWPRGTFVKQPMSALRPSWVEYHRVQTALWNLQAVLDIRRHANELIGSHNQPAASEAWSLSRISTIEPYTKNSAVVARVLEDIVITQSRQDHTKVLPNCNAYLRLRQMPIYSTLALPDRSWRLVEPPRNDSVGKAWGQDRDSVNMVSDGTKIWSRLLVTRHLRLTPEMMLVLRQLGLTLWDRKRLCSMGLIDEPDEIRGGPGGIECLGRGRRCWMSDDEIIYAWCSVAWNYVLNVS